MKKTFLLPFLLIGLSCSNEETQESVTTGNSNLTTIKYAIGEETYGLLYSIDLNGDLTPIENDNSAIVDSFIDENPTLIFHDIDEENIRLFANEKELTEFLNSSGKGLNKKKTLASKSSLYSCQNLSMYKDSYFGGGSYPWSSNSIGEIEQLNSLNQCTSPQYSYWQSGTDEARLKHFAISSNWTKRCNQLISCGAQSEVIRPNDQVSSLKVANVFARFYEHSNYGGRSITRDGRNGGSSFSRLKSVRYRGRWDNRISSVKLSF